MGYDRNHASWYRMCYGEPPLVQRRKYRNQPQVEGGERFDSKRELARYYELELLQKAHEISNLKRQIRFPLTCDGKPLTYSSGRQVVYVADFTYIDYIDRLKPRLVIEDAKGCRTDVYKLKRAIMRANGYEILET